jgi:hypothetical protein
MTLLSEHFGVDEYSNRHATISMERHGLTQWVVRYYEDKKYLGCCFYMDEIPAENQAENFVLGYQPAIMYHPDEHQGGVESFA